MLAAHWHHASGMRVRCSIIQKLWHEVHTLHATRHDVHEQGQLGSWKRVGGQLLQACMQLSAMLHNECELCKAAGIATEVPMQMTQMQRCIHPLLNTGMHATRAEAPTPGPADASETAD